MSNEFLKRILSSVFLIPIVFLIIINGSTIFNLFLLISFSIILYEWHKLCKIKNLYYVGILFLIFSFYTIYKLYNFNNNYLNFVFVIIICISTDIGGYVFGKLFKGPKLTSISPKKNLFRSYRRIFIFNYFCTYFFQTNLFFSRNKRYFFIYLHNGNIYFFC